VQQTKDNKRENQTQDGKGKSLYLLKFITGYICDWQTRSVLTSRPEQKLMLVDKRKFDTGLIQFHFETVQF
jgi:hypothetical protein